MKEKLTSITTSRGAVYDVYLLKYRDVINLETGEILKIHEIAAKAINVDVDEFLNLDFPDAKKIIEVVSKGFSML